jgi:hypothetical protein
MRLTCFFLLLMLKATFAGTGYDLRCEDAKCGFTASIGIGGGRMFEEASGYCPKCAKVVSVTWKRDGKPKSAPVRFWDALTGGLREIFRCQKCQGPFVKVEQIEGSSTAPNAERPR